jgi:hypothetical protein
MSKKSKNQKQNKRAKELLEKAMVAVGKKHEKKAQTYRPSTHRLDHYIVRQPRNLSHMGKLESIIKRNYNDLSASSLRRKLHSCALAAHDISEEASQTKRHRPAGASVLFKRGKYSTQQTKVVDAAAAAGAMKAALQREERAALKRKQGKATATINPRELLPPSLLETKKGFTRPHVVHSNRSVLQTWKYKPATIQPDVQKRRSGRFTAGPTV